MITMLFRNISRLSWSIVLTSENLSSKVTTSLHTKDPPVSRSHATSRFHSLSNEPRVLENSVQWLRPGTCGTTGKKNLSVLGYSSLISLTLIAAILPFMNWFSVAALSNLSLVNCMGFRELSMSANTCMGIMSDAC